MKDFINEKLDPKQYPTLVQYQPNQILDAVKRLQEKYPDMTEDQCLLNLEMSLAEQDQLARGS